MPHAPGQVPHVPHHTPYAPPPAQSAPPYATAHSEVASEESEIAEGEMVTSPMVGTFYTAPSPKDPPFVSEGDEVHAGDTVGIVEAMKMMNEIETEITGKVVQILVQNEQPVEYGQPLMVIAPH
jgi:acetyl-CoA carboxylase biotin carboxyl carrier protein